MERKSTKLPRNSVVAGKRKSPLSKNGKSLDRQDLHSLESDRDQESLTDYHSRLNELHHASKDFIRLHQKRKMSNDDFNYPAMNRENLHRSNSLIELDEEQSSTSFNSYLEQFRQRLFTYSTYMKSDVYREHVQKQLNNERELNQSWKTKITCLENNIKVLLEDTIQLLKLRTEELGVDELERPEQLITYANGISNKHKELRLKVISLEKEIDDYDDENDQINSILSNLCSNPYPSSTVTGPSLHDTTYSTLLANMSKQTQHETSHGLSPWTRPISVSNRDTAVGSNLDSMSSSKRRKFDGSTDFIIQKRSQKMSIRTPLGTEVGSSMRPNYPGITSLPITSLLPSRMTIGIDNLLSTKELQPMQVHSLVSSAGCSGKPGKSASPSLTRSFNIKNLISASSSSGKRPPSKDSETFRFVSLGTSLLTCLFSSHDMMEQFPRKKRDFYGRSSSPSPHVDPSQSAKRRPSSTPASPEILAAGAVSDRPSSIPLLNSSL